MGSDTTADFGNEVTFNRCVPAAHSSDDVSRVPFERIGMAFFGQDGTMRARLLAIRAEPGMGCSRGITAVLAEASHRGIHVVRRSYYGASQGDATRSLVRLASDVVARGESAVVGIDYLPPSDEATIPRQVRALKKMWCAGVSVIFTVCPEASQLLEQLPECTEISFAFLLLPSGSSPVPHFSSPGAHLLTRGIPSLASTLDVNPSLGDGGHFPPVEYFDALGNLMRLSLRTSLSDEERRIRLAMLLLGEGECRDLECVLGKIPGDSLEGIRANAPLFGLSCDLRRFSCLSGVVGDDIVLCLRKLSFACSVFPDVAPSCLRLLVERGAYRRVAALATLPESAPALVHVVAKGDEFLEIGEVSLVLHAIERAGSSCTGDAGRLGATARALSKSVVRAPMIREEGEREDDALDGLMDACRLIRGNVPVVPARPSFREGLSERLSLHLEACLLMCRGEFSAALTLLVSGPNGGGDGGVSDALLAMDREAARLLTGGSTTVPDKEACKAEEFVRSHALKGLFGYAMALRLIRDLLTEDPDVPEAFCGSASRYEHTGDVPVQIFALICLTISDLRKGSPERAKICASNAETLARSAGFDYLGRVAACVAEVAASAAGEEPVFAMEPAGDDLDRVRDLVRRTLLSDFEAPLVSPEVEEVPWDAIWLLRVLCTGLGGFSESLIERMPVTWVRAISANAPLRPRRRRAEGREASVTTASEAEGKPVELRLLGGFSLSIHGTRVEDRKLERRNAKSMIEYLALRGGSAKRYQLIEQIWPDSDYSMGYSRIYQTTSVVRKAVAELDKDLFLISANRSSGEISIDMGAISCDVDAFRVAAREAVDSSDDETKLECARRAERLYAGDLYVPTADASGYVSSLRVFLRTLYADAMVEGSCAALRMGRERVAARMAENATAADDLREDANAALVRALRASGREEEAQRRGGSFEARVRRSAGKRAVRRLPTSGPKTGAGRAPEGKCGAKRVSRAPGRSGGGSDD